MENTSENINDLIDSALEGVENALGRELYKTEDQKIVLNVLKSAFAKYKANDNLDDLVIELRKYKESSLKYSDGNNSVWHETVSVCGNEVFLGDTLDDLYNKCHELIEKRED
jgi:benzoyl-CoA reductase/2-hydroxyglutaryl-CoA dehydratase subunit BcrC/BadD/HgdB